jgi:hypothetical protein
MPGHASCLSIVNIYLYVVYAIDEMIVGESEEAIPTGQSALGELQSVSRHSKHVNLVASGIMDQFEQASA